MKPRLASLSCALAVVGCLAAVTTSAASTLPPGFTEHLVASGLVNPTAMAIAPDGRVFVCQQGGQLRVVKDGALLPTPFVTLTVNSSGERGLLGVAFDPAFETNRFVYVYYTATTPTIHNRVSRFTAAGDVAAPGSEFVLMDLETLGATNHNGGAIHFGVDGKLYVAVGENAVPSHAQTLANRLGKMLRINADGTIPDDNPFFDEAIGLNRSIWALGLRNPFTFSVQPASGRIFINDVGQGAWEEINDGMAGANYGWPATEGPTSDPRFVTPFHAYDRRGTGECAITGGAFYNPAAAQFPAEFVGTYFFADLCAGYIKRLNPADRGVAGFATGIPAPVDLKVSDEGSLYYLARGSGGASGVLYRIDHEGTPGANLIVAALKAPRGAAGGATITVKDTTRNEGPGGAAATRTGIWLSTNKTLGGDMLLGSRAVPALTPGQSNKGNTTVTLPSAPGIYFLIAEADTQHIESETHEGDNVRARKLTIGPDLSARMTFSPSPPTSGTPTTITITTTNEGYGTAAASSTRLYRSANGSIDGGDTVLDTIAVPVLAPGQSNTQQIVLTLPAGTYFLIVQSDATAVVAEANETNNDQKVKKS
jgi:glucose/arabinose dehydrogenase